MKKNVVLSIFIVLNLYSYGKTREEAIINVVSKDTIANEKKTIEEPFIQVDVIPQFPGGDGAMMQYIKDNIQYPKSAVKKGIEGQVTLRFLVSKDGIVEDVEIAKSLDPACDKEAVRLVKSMPKWIPGKQNGKAVDVYYTLPVRFKLEDVVKSKK